MYCLSNCLQVSLVLEVKYIFPYVSIYRLSTFTRRVFPTSRWWGYSSSTPRARLSAPRVTTAVIFLSTFRVNCESDLMCKYLKTGNVKRLLKPDSSLWLIAWMWYKAISCWQVDIIGFHLFQKSYWVFSLECVFNMIDCPFCARYNDVFKLCLFLSWLHVKTHMTEQGFH